MIATVLCLALSLAVQSAPPAKTDSSADQAGNDRQLQLKTTIEKHLGRPYVWGASGIRSFDCSGFVWRVMADNGILIKRTTARKLYISLPKVTKSEQGMFGNVVFFDNLKHCGIVNDESSFFHAQTSKGTNLSKFDRFWKPKVCGFRKMPE